MANIKFTFDTRKLEQRLKKQQQEAKRLADKQIQAARKQVKEEARIAVAKSYCRKTTNNWGNANVR